MPIRASLLAIFALVPGVLLGQKTGHEDPPGRAGPPVGQDARQILAEALAQVSTAELRSTVEALVACHNRNTYSESQRGERGIGAARRYLKRRLDAIAATSRGRMEVREEWFDLPAPRRRRGGAAAPAQLGTRGANVVATLRGASDPGRIYVVGGHYDSRVEGAYDTTSFSPGANDDASGTAAVVELARVLAGRELDATIVFACYTGEEQGLFGSRHHAGKLRESGARVAGMIALDMIGNTLGDNGVRDDRSLRVFSRSAAGVDSPSRQWARYAVELGRSCIAGYAPRLVYRLDRLGRGGDHRPFDELGWPAMRFTEPNEAYTRQHRSVRSEGGVSYGDVTAMVNFAYLTTTTRHALAVLLSAASAPPAPERVSVRGNGLRTQLSWRSAAAADLASYEVVWRSTPAAHWEGAERVGKETRARIERSADDYFYGVRAIDELGFKSPVAAPQPRAPRSSGRAGREAQRSR